MPIEWECYGICLAYRKTDQQIATRFTTYGNHEDVICCPYCGDKESIKTTGAFKLTPKEWRESKEKSERKNLQE